MKINLHGTAKKIEFSLEFAEDIKSDRDWLIAIAVYDRGSRIPTSDLSWHYSAKLDVNFSYLEKSAEVSIISLPEVTSTVPFDSLEIELIAWSRYARNAEIFPSLKRCVYFVPRQIIDGGEARAVTSTIGITSGKV